MSQTFQTGDTVWTQVVGDWWCNIEKRTVRDRHARSALVVSVCPNGDYVIHQSYYVGGRHVQSTERIDSRHVFATPTEAVDAPCPDHDS